MKLIKSLLTLLLLDSPCIAGNLNIVNLGPPQQLKLEIKAGGMTQQFSLPSQSATGIFALPQKPGVLRIINDETPSLKLEANASGQVAVLHPSGKQFKWSVYGSKPTEGQTSLRLINLTDKDVVLLHRDKKFTLKGKATLRVENVINAPIRLSFENGEKVQPHEQEDPSAVIGFVYRSGEKWNIFYVNDT